MRRAIFLFSVLAIFFEAQSQVHPNPRHTERIAYDTDRKKLILFGGTELIPGGRVEPEEVFEWDQSGWREFKAAGPGKRNGPTLVYHQADQVLYLIGGQTELSNDVKMNLDVWKWNGTAWTLVNSDCPFRQLEAVYDADNESILAFGDVNDKTKVWRSGDKRAFELWEYKSGSWKKLSGDGPQIEAPYEMAYDRKRKALVLPTWQGGSSVVWEWKNSKWNKIQCSQNCPAARNRHTIAYDEKQKAVFMFGGRTNDKPFLDDFWKWDGKSWTRIESELMPPMRCAASIEYGDGGLLLYGGVVDWGLTNELWQWKGGKWKLLNGEYAMDMNKTVALLNEQIVEHPADASLQLRYASLLKKQKKFSEAESAYKKSVAINPTEHNALFELVDLLYAQNKSTEADEYISKAIAANGMQGRQYSRVGVLLMQIKKYEQAVRCLEKSVELEHRGSDYYNLACAYSLANKTDKAIDALTKAVELGYGSRSQFENDTDLNSLKSDPRFKDILQRVNP